MHKRVSLIQLSSLPAIHGTSFQSSGPIPLKLTYNVGLVLKIALRRLHYILHTVPSVRLLADLLSALVVDTLGISDGRPAKKESESFSFCHFNCLCFLT